MTIKTINGIEYVDFRARFVALSARGMFEFSVLDEPGANPLARWQAYHSVSDREPAIGGFGLPESAGRGGICPNIHTIRLRYGWARAQGIL